MRIPLGASHAVQQTLRELWAVVDRFAGPLNIDLDGRRIINAGEAVDPHDYVTLAQLTDLGNSGTGLHPPANQLGTVLVGTHADRLLAPAGRFPIGTGYWETDRGALYFVNLISGLNVWVLYFGFQTGSYSARHSDLGLNDDNYWWMAQDQASLHRWTGASWHYQVGNIVGAFSTRPTAGGTDIATGFRFTASDHGYQQWVYDRANTWWQFAGGGEPTRGAISAITGSLGTHDTGYLFYATDYDRVYRWTGSAYTDAPGQPTRGQIGYFLSAPDAWWALCDGSGATISTANGSTSGFTTPNLTTLKRFLRSVSGSTGGTGGSATTHTHQVDPTATSSGNNSAFQEVQSGTGINVAANTHTHTTDIAAFASGVPSGISGDDALPPYFDANPYIRL